MLQVLSLFLIPVGGGIPAGVLLASGKGLSWPVTAGLYLFSDLLLAAAFEPILKLLVMGLEKIPFLARLTAALKLALAQRAPVLVRAGASPLSLVMVAFGVDPMTGRATALAAGHGFLAGWTIAISGDMLYYALIALATLGLKSSFRDPDTAVELVLGAMILLPVLARKLRARRQAIPSARE